MLPVCMGTSSNQRELQAESGMSGGVCGNGTHQGDKGGALIVSVLEVREGLSEKVTLEHMYEYREGGIWEQHSSQRDSRYKEHLTGGWDSASHRSGSRGICGLKESGHLLPTEGEPDTPLRQSCRAARPPPPGGA